MVGFPNRLCVSLLPRQPTPDWFQFDLFTVTCSCAMRQLLFVKWCVVQTSLFPVLRFTIRGLTNFNQLDWFFILLVIVFYVYDSGRPTEMAYLMVVHDIFTLYIYTNYVSSTLLTNWYRNRYLLFTGSPSLFTIQTTTHTRLAPSLLPRVIG